MNKWIEKSIQLAYSAGYLDNLYEIYPVKAETREIISEREIQKALRIVDSTRLVKEMLRLPKFPINDPFVGSLRYGDDFLQHNPKTVARIAEIIRSMGPVGVLNAISQPKVPSKQIGAMFKKWLPKAMTPMSTAEEFKKSQEAAFLDLGDKALKRFANEDLDCGLDKAPDLIAKKGDAYVVGEAKFITREGGGQDNQLRDALKLLRGEGGKATRIAILDGVLWMKSRRWMHREITQQEKPAFSALLLEEFLESL